MSEKVTNLLKEIKEERVKKLMGLAFDIGYFDKMIAEVNEDAMRNELKEEKEKTVLGPKGNVVKDDRDLDKIAKLEKEINRIVGIQAQRKQYIELYDDIKKYVEFLNVGADEETIKKVEEISNF
jgi:hypothetical protein